MMTGFFYVVGWAVTLGGLAWAVLLVRSPMFSEGVLVSAKVFALAPGFAVMGTGLTFVAFAAILHRLDRLIDGR